MIVTFAAARSRWTTLSSRGRCIHLAVVEEDHRPCSTIMDGNVSIRCSQGRKKNSGKRSVLEGENRTGYTDLKSSSLKSSSSHSANLLLSHSSRFSDRSGSRRADGVFSHSLRVSGKAARTLSVCVVKI